MCENNPIKDIFDNQYLSANDNHSSDATMYALIDAMNFKQLQYLPKKTIICASIRYPELPWSKKADVFEGLSPNFIQDLQNKECFFLNSIS